MANLTQAKKAAAPWQAKGWEIEIDGRTITVWPKDPHERGATANTAAAISKAVGGATIVGGAGGQQIIYYKDAPADQGDYMDKGSRWHYEGVAEALVEWVLRGRDPKKVLGEALNEGRFVIGAHGLERPDDGILIQPNTEYYMGASSSPDHIIVTRVDKDWITFREWPYKADRRIERWIGTDLIASGTKTWLRGPGAHRWPDTVRSLQNLLAGKPGDTVNPEDFRVIVVDVKSRLGVPATKLWTELEDTPPHYSVLGSYGDDIVQINSTMGDLPKIKADHRIEVVKVTHK